MPPYGAYALPANAPSTRVNATAKPMRLRIPSAAMPGAPRTFEGRAGQSEDAARRALHMLAARSERCRIHLVVDLCSQTSIDCWAKIPAIAPCEDARVTEGKIG